MGSNDNVRIAIGSAFVLVGLTLLGLGLEAIRGLQPSQPTPTWAIVLIVLGIVTLVVGLLVLIVPPPSWARLWQSIRGTRRWLKETYIWCFSEIEAKINEPAVMFELSSDGQQRKYKATLSMSVIIPEKMKYWPIRISFDQLSFRLKQKRGMAQPMIAPLEMDPDARPDKVEWVFTKPGQYPDKVRVPMSWTPYNNPSIMFIDITKDYDWEIKGVRVRLNDLLKVRYIRKKGRHLEIETMRS